MSLSRLEKDLFVIPHPDDETMLGHRIIESSEAWVVVATDGTASTVDHVGNNFVVTGGRREEARQSLEYLGVAHDRQCYLELPDGEVKRYVSELGKALLKIIVEHDISNVITLGESGYDGHTDHANSHWAAVQAVCALDPPNRPELFGLNSQHIGEYSSGGHMARKIGAIAHHVSQFDLTDPKFWKEFSQYVPLIKDKETYDRLVF